MKETWRWFDTATTFNPTIASGVTVIPTNVVFNSNINTYTLSGPGAIGGTTSIVKMGTGAAILANTNTYTGGTFIEGGVLSVAYDAALGAVPASAWLTATWSSAMAALVR